MLIVDDDVMVRTLTAALLEQMGCSCEGVATGADALARVARGGEPIDIVLLDQGLWRETGEQVCQRLREAGLQVPIVAVSGDGFALDARLREAGFDASMRKPFSAEELHACVEDCVGRARDETIEQAG